MSILYTRQCVALIYGVLCLFSSVTLFLFIPSHKGQLYYHGTITKSLNTLKLVDEMLPEVNQLGYISDQGSPLLKKESVQSEQADALKAEWIYNVSQYGLAPRILLNSCNERWVLGHFENSKNTEKVSKTYNFKMAYPLGNGFVLFQRSL